MACRTRWIVAVCAVMGWMVQCGGEEARDRSTVVIGISQEPDSLDPLFGQMLASTEVRGVCFRGMVERDNEWRVHPKCVEELPSLENGLWELLPGGRMRTTWHLKPGLKWMDGAPVTAKDAIFAYNVIMDERVPVISRDMERRIEKMEAPDPMALVVTWKEHYAYADLGHVMLAEHILGPIYRNDPENYEKHSPFHTSPTGDGPFRVVEWVPGSHISLGVNPNFFWGRPKLDRIVFKFIPDTNTLMANMIAGSIDAISTVGLTFDQGKELENQSEEIEVQFTPGITWEHIDFNLDDPWLSDKRVRQAMVYAIDREKMVRELFGGEQPVAHSWLPPKHYGYNSEVKRYPYDPEPAKRLFADAGWTPGPDGILRNAQGEKLRLVLMSTAGNKTREQVEQILQSYWRDAGVEIEIRNEPAKVFFGDTMKYRKFRHLAMYAWTFSPMSDGEGLWTADTIPSEENNWLGQNTPGWRNAEATEIDHRVPKELDPEKRATLLRREQEIWTEELPAIPLYFRADVTATRTGLRGWLPTGTSTPVTWNCEMWHFSKSL